MVLAPIHYDSFASTGVEDCYSPSAVDILVDSLPSERGTYQGDVLSPTLFDIVIDCIIREWYRRTRCLLTLLFFMQTMDD